MTAGAVNEETIYTIGHSTHEIGTFVALLMKHGIDAIADVRSVPYSRRQPQFNCKALANVLRSHGIAYAFLGRELGARSDDPACYEKGRVKYRLLARTPLFRSGIERIRDGSHRMNIALMCAEREPLDCHRTILVARQLVETGADLLHILASGDVEHHNTAMARLVEHLNLPEKDMFSSAMELEDLAYAAQERRIAYVDRDGVRDAQEDQQ